MGMAKEPLSEEHNKARARMLPYWAALGAFVDRFAHVELTMKAAIARATGITDDMMRIVLGGTRGDNAATYLGRLDEINVVGHGEPGEITEYLVRFSTLNKMRNDLVHFGVDTGGEQIGDEMRISNKHLARTPNHLNEFTVTPQIVLDMAHDLTKIYFFFGLYVTGDRLGSATHAAGRRFLEGAWRYTPPQLEGQLRKIREGSRT